MRLFSILFFATCCHLYAQSPVWPLATNPHDYNTSNPVPSESVTWLPPFTLNPQVSQIPNGPLNTAHGPSMGGFDCCGNMLFYVIHSGSIYNNELWVKSATGEVILKDGNGANVGLNGVRTDGEVQVIRVPKSCDEWYIIYLENDDSRSDVFNIYDSKHLLYTHIKYNSSSGLMMIVSNRINEVLFAINDDDEYQHGKAATSDYLYAIRRKFRYDGTISTVDPIIDRFRIGALGITYDAGSSSAPIDVPYYQLTCPSSGLELSNNGTELAFMNYDQNSSGSKLFTFNNLLGVITLNRTIVCNNVIIKPLGTQALPANYFTGATQYFISNPSYNMTNEWLTANVLGNNLSLNLRFLSNFSRKLSDIQFSPNGNFLYLTHGGFVSGGQNNLTYLVQLDLNSYNPINNSAIAAIKIQSGFDIANTNGITGGSLSWSGQKESNFYNSHELARIESAVDGNLYFTKRASSKLFVIPDPNIAWLSSDLYGVELDLSSSGHPNINTTNDVFYLPDHIDGFDYSPVDANINFTTSTNEICKGAGNLQLTATPTGGQWSGSTLVSSSGLFTPLTIGQHVVIYSVNGCYKKDTIIVKDCVQDCCPVFRSVKDSVKCSLRLTRQQDGCTDSISSIKIKISNGTIGTGGVSSSCTGMLFNPSSYVGGTAVNITNVCYIKPDGYLLLDLEAIDCQKPILVTFEITMVSGKVCPFQEMVKCACPPNPPCCAKVQSLFTVCEPMHDLLHGKFTITNLDPSSPICKVKISASPSTSFSNSGLMIDNNTLIPGSFWNPMMIPGTGTISVLNYIMFSLATDISYTGNITITVMKCDSTMCTFTVKWKGKSGPTSTIRPVQIPLQIETGYGLSAYQFQLKGSGNNPIAAKYCSIGMDTNDCPKIFAISGAMHSSDSFPTYLEPVELAQMGNNNAFFGLCCPRPLKQGESSGLFNLVLKVKKEKGKTTPLRITLFDDEGGIIYSDTLIVNNLTTDVSTSIIEIDEKDNPFNENLISVYPNPAANDLTIEYILGNAQMIKLELFNSNGILVKELVNERKSAGLNQLLLDISNLTAGAYFIKMHSESDVSNVKFQVVK